MGEIRVKTANLFDISSDVHGYINGSGNFVPNNSYTATDYIEIPPNAKTLYCSAITKSGQPVYTGLHVAVYDENKTLLTYDMDYNKSKISMSVDISLGKYFRADVCSNDYTECMVSFENVPYKPYFLNLPSHEKTSTGWKDIPTHTMTATGWQGELTSQSPLEFRATGQSLLDWRVDGKTSKNLFDINGEHISVSRNGIRCFIVDDGKLIVQIISPGSTTQISYPNNFYNPTVYTVSAKLTGELTGIRFLSTSPFPGGTYNATYKAYFKSMILNGGIYTITVSPTETTTIGFVVVGADDARNPGTVEDIQILSGTYTSETIPPYEPYGGVGDWDETEQKYKIPVNVRGESENLFDIGTSATDYTSPSYTNLTISNDTLSMKLSSEPGMTYAVRKQQQTQKGAVTFALDTDCNTGIGIIVRIRDNDDTRWLTSSDTSMSGFTYNNVYSGWYKWTPLNNGHPIQAITIPNVGSYYYVGFLFVHSSSTVGNVYSATNIRLLEGTYTSETLPPYEPYINTTTNLYTTAQLMDGDSLDFATDQTTIPITQGDNTLTVGTQVQPSKVFIKFEG